MSVQPEEEEKEQGEGMMLGPVGFVRAGGRVAMGFLSHTSLDAEAVETHQFLFSQALGICSRSSDESWSANLWFSRPK